MSSEPNPEINFNSDPVELATSRQGLNNFHLLFPATEEVVGVWGDYRKLVKKLGKEESRIGKEISKEQEEAHSQKWLDQTYKDFFTTVDEATKKAGIEMSEISRLRDKVEQTKDPDLREEIKKQLKEKLWPIYDELIGMGYKPYDLVI